MPTNSPRNYSKIQTLCNIVTQYAQQASYSWEQVGILEESLTSLHSESFEAESLRQQLESARAMAIQTEAAEIASFSRLRAAIDEIMPSE